MEFGEKRVWKGTGRKRRCIAKKEGMVYVPLLNQLQFLLNDSEIYSQVYTLGMHAVNRHHDLQ